MNEAPSRDLDKARAFRVFAFCWGLAHFLHQVRFARLAELAPDTVLTLAAVAVLLRPSSSLRLAALAAVHLVQTVLDAPININHWWVMAFANAGILIAASGGLRSGPGTGPGHMYRVLVGPLRWAVVLVYGFAAFAKLNAGFFDLELSCAVAIQDKLVRRLPFLPTDTVGRQLMIYGTVAAELAIPLLVAVRRTRKAGLWILLVFHAALALIRSFGFGSVGLALYALFLPPGAYADAARRWSGARRLGPALERLRRWCRHPAAFPTSALLLIGIALPGTLGWVELGPVQQTVIRFGRIPFFCLMAVAAIVLWRAPPVPGSESKRGRPLLAAWCVPALVVLNALCPYVGLKTEASFTMYSNLRTEGDSWNHLLLPRSLRVFGMQDDLVRILSSSDPDLQEIASRRDRLTWLHFRMLVLDRPHASIDFVHRGRRRRVQVAEDAPDLREPLSPWIRKILNFRPIPPKNHNTCRH